MTIEHLLLLIITMKVHTHQNLKLYIDSRLQWVAKNDEKNNYQMIITRLTCNNWLYNDV